MKNAKKFIKLYFEKSQESFDKWGYYYPPRDWDEFKKWEKKTFKNHLKEYKNSQTIEELVLKTKVYTDLLDNLKDFGFFCVFEKIDYKDLNNVIFQTTRRKILDKCMTAGTHEGFLLFEILCGFACNDFESVNYFFPKELSYFKDNFIMDIGANLLKMLFYDDKDSADLIIEKAHLYLKKKNSSLDQYIVKYLIALYNRDLQEINICLQELCKGYQRQGYPVDKIDKCFAAEIHGLYRFARFIDKDFFEKIEMPKHDCFFKEFEIWQKENNYPEGELFYQYPPKLDYMNKVFQAEIPKMKRMEIKYRGRIEIYKDADLFALELTKNVMKINSEQE